jgi:hypothetical protein
MIVSSIAASTAISVAMDVVGLQLPTFATAQIFVLAALFNATAILQSVVGSVIEWRRPGHAIGRLLMLSGPAYGFVSAGWTTGSALASVIDPQFPRVASWAVLMISYPAVALIAGWIPLVFPTGTLPGPRWRLPVGLLAGLSGIGLAAMALGPFSAASGITNPFGVAGWPGPFQPFADALPLELVVLLGLGAGAVITRYRRGDGVERLQIRWFASAVAITAIGFLGSASSYLLGTTSTPISTSITLVAYAGIMLMPVAIGIAVLRYRLFEIDRIISRTIGWAVVTGILGIVFSGTIVGLQGILAGVTQAQTLAVAASTLVAFVLFQPLRRRVQAFVDHRFNRARYDAERTAAAFGDRQRDQVNIAGVTGDIAATIDAALSPRTVTVWIRSPGRRGRP